VFWGLAAATAFVACGGSRVPDSASSGGQSGCAACANQAGDSPLSGAAGDEAGGGFGGSTGPGEAGAAGSDAAAGEAGSAASVVADDGVRLSEISFWQTVRVPLEANGSPAEPSTPVVEHKPGILRVFVQPEAAFRARQLSARLELAAGQELVSSKLIRASSLPGDFTSTFNFPLDASEVNLTTSYSLTLRDGPGGAILGRYPDHGQSPLGAVSAGGLRVVLVPIVASGIAPDVSPDTVSLFQSRLAAMYPVSEVTITVHAPLVTSVTIGTDVDQGWGDTLDRLYALRAAEVPPENAFYYGVFTPTTSFDDYCTSTCTVGLSNVAAPDEIENRGAVGLGIFADGSNADAPDTMAHELGHALGRRHAPCQTTDPGPFPYAKGKIGVWGFDVAHHLLLDPTAYSDVMGYCSPDWISDYTYDALFTRLAYVNGQSMALGRSPQPTRQLFRRVLVSGRGSLSWGRAVALNHAPHGEPRALTLLSQRGDSVAAGVAYYQPFSDGGGGFLLVSEALLSGMAELRLGSARLAIPPGE